LANETGQPKCESLNKQQLLLHEEQQQGESQHPLDSTPHEGQPREGAEGSSHDALSTGEASWA